MRRTPSGSTRSPSVRRQADPGLGAVVAAPALDRHHPANVVESALQNAASVASLQLTTEAMVVDKPEEDVPMTGVLTNLLRRLFGADRAYIRDGGSSPARSAASTLTAGLSAPTRTIPAAGSSVPGSKSISRCAAIQRSWRLTSRAGAGRQDSASPPPGHHPPPIPGPVPRVPVRLPQPHWRAARYAGSADWRSRLRPGLYGQGQRRALYPKPAR